MTVEPSIPCEHRALRPLSGGYYLQCADCGHTWTCESHNGTPPSLGGSCGDGSSCQSPLQGRGGSYVWRDAESAVDATGARDRG